MKAMTIRLRSLGYPYLPDLQLDPQFPSVAMLNWTTGAGTAKYWISKLLIDTADIGHDRALMTQTTDTGGQNVFSQGFVRTDGRRWVLLVNKRYAATDVFLPGATDGMMLTVDADSGFGPPIEIKLTLSHIVLNPFAVAVVHMPHMARSQE